MTSLTAFISFFGVMKLFIQVVVYCLIYYGCQIILGLLYYYFDTEASFIELHKDLSPVYLLKHYIFDILMYITYICNSFVNILLNSDVRLWSDSTYTNFQSLDLYIAFPV